MFFIAFNYELVLNNSVLYQLEKIADLSILWGNCKHGTGSIVIQNAVLHANVLPYLS